MQVKPVRAWGYLHDGKLEEALGTPMLEVSEDVAKKLAPQNWCTPVEVEVRAAGDWERMEARCKRLEEALTHAEKRCKTWSSSLGCYTCAFCGGKVTDPSLSTEQFHHHPLCRIAALAEADHKQPAPQQPFVRRNCIPGEKETDHA